MNKKFSEIIIPGLESLSGQTRLSCLQYIKPYVDTALDVSCPIINDGNFTGLKLPSPDGTFERSTIYLYMGYNGNQALSSNEGLLGRMYKNGISGIEFPQYQCYVSPGGSGVNTKVWYFNPTTEFGLYIDTTFAESAGIYFVSFRTSSTYKTFPMFCVCDMKNMITNELETVCISFGSYYNNSSLAASVSFFDGNTSRQVSKYFREQTYTGRSFYPCNKLSIDRFISDNVYMLGVYDNIINTYFNPSIMLSQDGFCKDGMIIDGKHYYGSLFAYGDDSAPHILCLKE